MLKQKKHENNRIQAEKHGDNRIKAENETPVQVSFTDEPAPLHIRLAFANEVANAWVLIVMDFHDY